MLAWWTGRHPSAGQGLRGQGPLFSRKFGQAIHLLHDLGQLLTSLNFSFLTCEIQIIISVSMFVVDKIIRKITDVTSDVQ